MREYVSSDLLTVRRRLVPASLRRIRDGLEEVAEEFPKAKLRLRYIDSVYVNMVGRGEYAAAARHPDSALRAKGHIAVAGLLNDAVQHDMPFRPAPIGTVTGCRTLGLNQNEVSIAYELGSPELLAERRWLTEAIDEIAGAQYAWNEEFKPMVQVALMSRARVTDDLLEAAQEVAGGIVLLQGVQAIPDEPAPEAVQ